MADSTHQRTWLWSIPDLDDLELFRAEAIYPTYARHSHSGYAIGMIQAGVGGNHYRGSTYLAPPNSIVLMNPAEVHTGYAIDAPLTYRMFYVGVASLQQLAGELQARELPHFREAVVADPRFAHALCSVHRSLEQIAIEQPCDSLRRKAALPHLEQQARLVELLSALLVRYADVKIQPIQPGKEQRLVRLIQDYLHENCGSPISLEQLVALTHLNRSYLIRVFCKAVGMPPYTYLNQVRVEKAKQLLAQGRSIADVTVAVGMSDQSHLNRHFKRIVGVTPGHYRRVTAASQHRSRRIQPEF
jgi:AraC-like DNA-binding protein